MKATIDAEGHLKIEVGSIIESLSESDLRTFAKYAVFQEHLLRGVIDALVSGMMWADDEEPAWWFGGDTFNKLRLKLLPLLPEVMAEAVRHLDREMRQARIERDAWRDACWALERDWPEGRREPKRWSERERALPMTKAEAADFLRRVESAAEDNAALAEPPAFVGSVDEFAAHLACSPNETPEPSDHPDDATPARVLHCWADGPCSDDDIGSTCMLPAGHEGEHEWTRDDGIGVSFAAEKEQG